MRTFLSGVGNAAIIKLIVMLVRFLSAGILARNLSPADYGIVGVSMVIIVLLQSLNGMGLNTAVIRSPQIGSKVLDTAATLNIGFSLGAFIIAQIIAPYVGQLMNSPESVAVIRVAAISFLLNPVAFLPSCLLTREMKFGILRTPTIAGAIVYGGIAVGMAVGGFGYWSLVAASLAAVVVTKFLIQMRCPTKFSLAIDPAEARTLLKIGFPLTASGLITFAVFNADKTTIGATLGPEQLGIYTLAFTWATMLCSTLSEVVHTVIFPMFAKIQEDNEALKEGFMRSFRLTAFVAAYGTMGIFVIAEWFLIVGLGGGTDRWAPAVPILHCLTIYGFIRAVTETLGNPIVARGDTKALLIANGIAAGVQLCFLPMVAKNYGLIGVGFFVSFAYLLQWLVYGPYVKRQLGIGFSSICLALAPAVVASMAAVSAAFLIKGDGADWSIALVRGMVFAITYPVVHELSSNFYISRQIREAWLGLQSTRAAESV